MGRLIDEDILIDSIPDLSAFEQEDFGTPDMIRLIEDAPTVQAIPKDQYETRLKADMVAMIEKIRAEIEQITDTMGVSYNQYVSKIDVLQILDKYNEETEKT